ncbi:hypothetical protein [uncultured Thiothrix sp.]|uniref:hypothetical protein n=1 Tax=uncultured Thiothrix sp. TaxID=223185 RepID=UPI00260EE2EC|nr:hypothetical protein [uncultured Thiothrix sp.]
MTLNIEVIRENLTPNQVLEIRREAIKAGCTVNINRLHAQLVEIQIIHPNKTIELNPRLIQREILAHKT